jgi:hypothetical protein
MYNLAQSPIEGGFQRGSCFQLPGSRALQTTPFRKAQFLTGGSADAPFARLDGSLALLTYQHAKRGGRRLRRAQSSRSCSAVTKAIGRSFPTARRESRPTAPLTYQHARRGRARLPPSRLCGPAHESYRRLSRSGSTELAEVFILPRNILCL